MCIGSMSIDLDFEGVPSVTIGGHENGYQVLGTRELDLFAQADGFECFDEMAKFWRDVHNTSRFVGTIIKWIPLNGAQS